MPEESRDRGGPPSLVKLNAADRGEREQEKLGVGNRLVTEFENAFRGEEARAPTAQLEGIGPAGQGDLLDVGQLAARDLAVAADLYVPGTDAQPVRTRQGEAGRAVAGNLLAHPVQEALAPGILGRQAPLEGSVDPGVFSLVGSVITAGDLETDSAVRSRPVEAKVGAAIDAVLIALGDG